MIKRCSILAGLAAIAFLANPLVAHAGKSNASEFNELNCGWPLSLSPEGPANFQGPDDAARYYIMPFDTTQYRAMTLRGTYPHLRYFAIAAYEVVDTGSGGYTFEVGDPLYDAEIVPDQGVNPFVPPGGVPGTYTVEIAYADGTGSSANASSVSEEGSPNTIRVTADLVWIVLRAYVPDADASLTGQSLMGGVPLPIITATSYSGDDTQLVTCSPINKWSDLMALGRHLFPPEVNLTVDEGTPSSDRLWFGSPKEPPPNLWPNPDGKYLMMLPGSQYQTGRVIVIHGKAPGFPDTFNGSPVWVPSKGFRRVDMRYWAVCNMNLVWPPSVVACATDLTTRLQGRYYTIVISDDRQRPDWLKPTVNWIPWGDGQYPKFVVLRNILSSPDFDHDYYPVALWCDKATFRAGGFQACLKDGE